MERGSLKHPNHFDPIIFNSLQFRFLIARLEARDEGFCRVGRLPLWSFSQDCLKLDCNDQRSLNAICTTIKANRPTGFESRTCEKSILTCPIPPKSVYREIRSMLIASKFVKERRYWDRRTDAGVRAQIVVDSLTNRRSNQSEQREHFRFRLHDDDGVLK